jgi:hypothetical protein
MSHLLVENDIEVRITYSEKLSEAEKQNFLHFLCYFTPEELEELGALI